MIIQPLASGSRGNAVWVSSGNANLLVDCGLPHQDLITRLRAAGRRPRMIHAILITHGHLDHVRGLRRMSRYTGAPVFMESGLRDRGFFSRLNDVRGFRIDEPFELLDFEIEAFRVSHDAVPTVGFRVSTENGSVGLTTDLGCGEGRVAEVFSRCDAVYIESNYDEAMLRDGPYRDALKDRVSSDLGHLSNRQAAEIIDRFVDKGVRHIVLAHLSEINNTRELARRGVQDLLKRRGLEHVVSLSIAHQDEPSQVIDLTRGAQEPRSLV